MPDVPLHLRDWVKERQATLDRLLIEEPGNYLKARLAFQQEYDILTGLTGEEGGPVMEHRYCCKAFAESAEGRTDMRNPRPPQFNRAEDGTWDIMGCCGYCYVVEQMRFCPYCGSALKKENT